ncbi:IclR family transcriptional regulator [Bacillus timonensis]|uniref:Glycerol operon regulatory protein n=1 Tax=Bacillus timonensis TaxID=1033734 RepID=A0A4S3PQD2_9BACI|nr:IclR family transcriptional regulator [Bacillus timonensis]THE11857.1 IclR family transcriptional regulator [Bacillus timonensis]
MSKNQVPSVHKAINILELLKEHDFLTLKDISNSLKLPTSTCYNILTTLENRGFIQRNTETGQYILGLTLMHLGLSIYNKIDLKKVGTIHLSELSEDFGETAYLTVLDRSHFKGIVVERLQSKRTGLVYSRNIGDTFPIYASGTGKSLLSGLNDEEINYFFEKTEMISYTSKTITNEEKLRDEIQDIRRKGYAISNSAFEENVISVSSPIKDSFGKVIAAVSLVGPVNRISPIIEAVIESVKRTAFEISKAMGYK